MSRIVLTTIGSFGDLHPKIAIALELRDRGHQVVFATHKEYQAKIEALGFEFHRMRPDNTALNDPEEMARMMDLRTGTEYIITQWLCGNLRETFADLMSCATNADLIVAGEGVIPARLVAEKLGIRWVSCVLQPAAFLSVHDPSVIPIFPTLSKLRGFGSVLSRVILQMARTMSRSWAEPIVQLRQELGLSPLTGNPFVDDKYSPYLTLALFSSTLAKPQPDWVDSAVQTGFTFFDGSDLTTELDADVQQFLAAGESPIVFTLGSAAVRTPGNFYSESIEAIQKLNRRAILLIGKNSLPEQLSDNILAVQYLPYSQIFSHAAAIVHQGGIGTTAQALRAGRPTIVMPYSHDQPDNAARVARLGTSRTIPRKRYSAERVATELQELLTNPNYAAKSAEIGQGIQAENGAAIAADAIEEQLKNL